MTDLESYIKGILASATFPAVLPTVSTLDDGRFYVDGGVAHNVDIHSAVNWCKEQVGGDESKITVDIYLNSGGTFHVADVSEYNSL